jgi:RNA-directed DNA polymerase
MAKQLYHPTADGKHTEATPALPRSYALPGCGHASVTGKHAWSLADWGSITRPVRQLQVRIAEAYRTKRYRKAKALQNVLRRSLAAKMLAVRRVTENTGAKTPGVDGELWKTPDAKWKAVCGLTGRGYRAKPLRRIHIPKANGKKRPLGIPVMRDRAMQALHLLCLEPISETTADANSYGFRPHRSCHDAIARCFSLLAKSNAPQWILEGDIRGCFDNISHEWMLQNIPAVSENTLKKWFRCGYIERGRGLFPTTAGTPQGSIISPTLANMVLDGLEDHINRVCGIRHNGHRYINPMQVYFVRYADDFVVTSNSPDVLETQVKPAIRSFLSRRGLALSEEKTHLTHIDRGFDFLGQNVRKYKGKLLIKPSQRSVETLLRKVKSTIRRYCTAKTIDLIDKLNPILRGWGLYHRHIVAAETFHDIDNKVWKMTWQWVNRRHSNHKTKVWMMQHYYPDGDWVLGAKDDNGNEERLIQLDRILIRRHVKIRADANPFDPKDEAYFEQRTYQAQSVKQYGRSILRTLLKEQYGKCLLCGQPFTNQTGMNAHHLEEKYLGGRYELENLVLLHPVCHTQVHQHHIKLLSPYTQRRKATAKPCRLKAASKHA